MLAKAYASALVGVEAVLVEVEADVGPGLPGFEIVGLPGAAVRESKDRVRAAVRNTGFDFPMRRITVNLAPAHLRKEGPAFDLPIALAILAACERLPVERLDGVVCAGELSLDGGVKPIRGALAVAAAARQAGKRFVLVPEDNAGQAAWIDGIAVVPVHDLAEAVGFLDGTRTIVPVERRGLPPATVPSSEDWSDVRGQEAAQRALEVAAAGGHNVAMIGPPGVGKTMLARRFAGILPPLSFRQAIEASQIHSVAGLLGDGLLVTPPFRHPHHTCTVAGMIGGGPSLRPGEVSLAHHGILFLDEYPEFRPEVIEALRQPVEEGRVVLSRNGHSITLPAGSILLVAGNPCPCGYLGDSVQRCQCSAAQLSRYRRFYTGPLWDRIDIQITLARPRDSDLLETGPAETTEAVRARVAAARLLQERRFAPSGAAGSVIGETEAAWVNAQMGPEQVRRFCQLDRSGERLLYSAARHFRLSGRAVHRVLKVARTIADLSGSEAISDAHVAEAVQYRLLPAS